MENDFYLVFTAQKKLFNQTIYTDLYDVFRRDSFSTIACKLATKYAHDSYQKDDRIEQLFRLWLVLAPIFDRIPGIFRLNWSKSNFISLIAYLTSQLTKYYYALEIPLEIYDVEKLKEGLQVLHIIDKNFANKTIEIYKAYYGSNNALGNFAKVILNKIFFAGFAKENIADTTNKIKLLQRYDKIVKLSKTLFIENENASKPPLAKPKNTNRSKNIMRESVDIWDYQLSRHVIKDKTSTKRETKLKIILSYKTIKEFKERLMACKTEKEIVKTCETFVEKHKYVFTLNNQFLFLNEFIKKHLFKHNIKTKYNIYQRYLLRSEIIKNLPKQATTQYLESVFAKDYKDIDQDVFLFNYMNPYKEL